MMVMLIITLKTTLGSFSSIGFEDDYKAKNKGCWFFINNLVIMYLGRVNFFFSEKMVFYSWAEKCYSFAFVSFDNDRVLSSKTWSANRVN